jgi:phage gpG-like protein
MAGRVKVKTDFNLIITKDLSKEILSTLKDLSLAKVKLGLPHKTGKTVHEVSTGEMIRRGFAWDGSGLTMAQLGAVHEFGAGNVPQRSFIRSAMTTHRDDVMRLLENVLRRGLQNQIVALSAELDGVGAVGTGYVVEQFNLSGSPAWAPLSSYTLARREHGGDKPLWDTGQLVQSITWEVKIAKQ